MPSSRRAMLVLALLLTALAVPGSAHATLLVRSDGAGLLIQDKNGLSDFADVFSTTLNGQTAYLIRNLNDGDVFKFDRQAGCVEQSSFEVKCTRNGSAINVLLAGGSDRFSLGGAPLGTSSVAAGSGNDDVLGHSGRDNLHGQTGSDTLTGNAGNDDLEGDDGDDGLNGSAGDDDLEGGANADRLTGSTGTDILRGGDGNDSHFAREPSGTTAVADTVSCGTGTDFVEADLKDSISSSCENREIAAVGETPTVRVLSRRLRVSSGGRVRVRLRCPRGVGSLGCRGRLRLQLARGAGSSASRRVRYRMESGRRRTVTLRLTARDVRRLRTRQRRGRRTRGVLTSVERGRLGRKTVVRRPRLRLAG